MSDIKVSVVVPVYNAEKYLEHCISSIANQTLEDIEIIAINDGSTDNSLNILNKLSEKYNGKLKVINSNHSGAGGARNIGIENSSGEYIKFVDADDYLEVHILEKMYTIAKEKKVSLVRGNNTVKIGIFKFEDKANFGDYDGNQVIDVKKDKDYIVKETPAIGNKLIKSDLLKDLRFPENTKWEDLAIIPIVIASSEKIYHLDEPVYNYRVNMNTTVRDFINKIPNILDIIKCVDFIEEQMTVRGLAEEYKSQIESLYILHTLFRIENAMTWINFQHKKKETVISSLLYIIESKYPDWRNNPIVKLYEEKNTLFKFDMSRLFYYINKKYMDSISTVGAAKENTRKSFR